MRPESALIKDGKRYYVMKAQNRKFLEPGKGLDPTFKVEKIEVVPGNLRRLQAGFTYVRLLKDSGSLEKEDVILTDHPKGLKNGDYVNFLPARYIFMPNELVKVNIGIGI